MPTEPDRLDQPAWPALASALRGRLLLPGQADYERRRRVWNGAIDRHPLAIASCVDAADVGACMGFASRTRLPVTVRGGGHNVAGLAVRDDALMVDLGAMNRVEVDAAARIVRVEGGALWQDVDAATQPHGLATTGGFISSTGVGGYTLGGGVGWLMRRCGLAVDNLIEAGVVLADGRRVVANARTHHDVFWALRGGGGGVGVVTQFTYRLHTVGDVYAGIAFYPIDAMADLLRVFRAVTPHAPNAFTAMLVVTSPPPLPFLPAHAHGQRMVALAFCWSGAPDHLDEAVTPLVNFGTPLGRHQGVLPYAAWQQTFDPTAPAGDHYYWTTSQCGALDDALIEALAPRAATPPDPLCEVHIHHLGGAVADVPRDATAFSQRDTPFFINVIGHAGSAARFPAVREWTRDLRSALAPHTCLGMQPNFTSEADDLVTRTHDTATYARLMAIRAGADQYGLLALKRAG